MRVRGGRRARREALVFAAAAAGLVRAELTIIAGPAELVGLRLAAPSYAFAAGAERVAAAPIVWAPAADWDASAGCPPRYVGADARVLARAIVIAEPPARGACSAEQLARAAIEAHGAAGWAHVPTGGAALARALQPVPGGQTRAWERGDARSLRPRAPAVDLFAADAAPLLDALARSRAAVRAALAPARVGGAWAAAWDGGAWMCARVLVALQALLTLELLVSRILAFQRAAMSHQAAAAAPAAHGAAGGGAAAPWSVRWAWVLGAPGLTLALEGVVCVERLLHALLDGGGAQPLLPSPLALTLVAMPAGCGAVAACTFAVAFFDAAAAGGLPSLALSLRARRGVLGASGAAVAFELSAALASATAAPGARAQLGRLGLSWVVLPSAALAFSARATAGVQRARRHRAIAGPVLSRVRAHLRVALASGALALACALSAPWWALRPRGRLGGGLCMLSALNCRSYAHCAALRAPPGATLRAGGERASAPGPLHALLGVCARALLRALGLSHPCAGCAAAGAEARPGSKRVLPSIWERPLRLPIPWQLRRLAMGPLPPHLLLGVSPDFLDDLCRMLRVRPGETAYEVSERLWEHLFRQRLRSSLAEQHVGTLSESGAQAVGLATHFVSHAHACDFRKMVEALHAHAALHDLDTSSIFYWLDLVCLRQFAQEADLIYLGALERRVGRVVLVLDPWDKPVALTRAWCLWELMHALDLPLLRTVDGGGPLGPAGLSVAIAPAERARLISALAANRPRVLDQLGQYDVRTAGVPRDADRDVILHEVRARYGSPRHRSRRRGGSAADPRGAGAERGDDDGIEAFNARTRAAIREALAAESWHI